MSKQIKDFDEIIARIRSHLPDYLAEKGIDYSKNFSCLNPDHEDKNPSMCLISKNQEHPRVYCFSCGASLDLLDLVRILDKKPAVGIEWIHDTVKSLAEKYHIEVQFEDLTEEQSYELDTYRAYRAASQLLVQTELDKFPVVQQAIKDRGWTEQTLKDNDIGFIPDYIEFRDKLKDLGFPASFLDEIDLSRRDIFNPNNLIFTWKDEFGRPIGFTARNLLYESQKAEAEEKGKKCTTTKYNNQRTTGLRCNIFQKGARLYGIDKAIKATPPLYLFEGQADVISARNAGLLNCAALAGSSLSIEHVLLIKRLKIQELILCLDSDTVGQDKQAKILEEKLSGHQDLQVKLIILPEGEDPDSFIRKNGLEAFRQLTHYSAFEWRLGKYPENEDPVKICKQMIPFIVNESSPIEREVLSKTLARHTGISLKAISDELGAMLHEKEHLRSKERSEAIERISYHMSKDPGNAEIVLREGLSTLVEISKKYDNDVLSAESCLKEIRLNKEKEESINPDIIGVKLCPDMKPFQDALMGECKDTWGIVGGKENVGKCQAGDTLILLADGRYKRLDTLVQDKDQEVISLGKDYKFTKKRVLNWFSLGVKQGKTITLANGTPLTAANTHPYLTDKGYKCINELKIGDYLATARSYKNIDFGYSCNLLQKQQKAILLACYIAEGCLSGSAIGFSNTDPEIITKFKTIITNLYGNIEFRTETNNTIYPHIKKGTSPYINPVKTFLEENNLIGHNSYKKRIPDWIFQCDLLTISKFLGMLYACDGWVSETTDKFEIGISFCNKELLNQTRSLLLRFGIAPNITESTSSYTGCNKRFPRFSLIIGDIESAALFYNAIKIMLTSKQEHLKQILTTKAHNAELTGSYTHNLPNSFWKIILSKSKEQKWSKKYLLELIDPVRKGLVYKKTEGKHSDRFVIFSKYSPDINKNLNRRVALTCGHLLNSKELINIAEGDISYSQIVDISEEKSFECFDIEVEDTNNYLANNVVSHNSSLMRKLAYSILISNPDTICIYHTIDDSRAQLLPGLISIAENSHLLTMNQVRFPSYFTKMVEQYPSLEYLSQRRETGYSKILELIQQGRLVIKDAIDGMSVSFIEALISYHQDKQPDKKIFFFLDNFHKLMDFGHLKEERIRFKTLSATMKEVAVRKHMTIFSTAEYTKLAPGVEPNNHSVAESVQMCYDANFIVHVYSELADLPDKYTVCHWDYDWRGDRIAMPRIKINIGKNKISEVKSTFFMDFWPACSDFRWVSQEQVVRDQEIMRQERSTKGSPYER